MNTNTLASRPRPRQRARHRALRLAGLLLCAAAPAQRFEYDHGKPLVQEIGIAMVQVQTGYVTVGTAGSNALGIGVNVNGQKIVDGCYTPMIADPRLEPNCLRPTADGGFIVSGELPGNGLGREVFLAKFDKNGNNLWGPRLATYRGDATGIRQGTRVVEMADRGFGVITNIDVDTPSSRGVLFVTSPVLLMNWWKSYTYNDYPLRFHDLRQDANGDFVIVGTLQQPTQPLRSTMVLRTTVAGVPIAATLITSPQAWEDIDQQAITATRDGGFAIWGHYGAGLISGSFLLKVTGGVPTPVWYTIFDQIGATRPTIAEAANGDLLCNGRLGADALVLRTNSTGVKQFARTYGGAGVIVDEIFQVIPTSDGGFAATGATEILDGSKDVYLLKGDASLRTHCNDTEPVVSQGYITPDWRPMRIQATEGGTAAYVYIQLQTPCTDPDELCFEPACVKAPRQLDLWLPFDETSGVIANNVLSMAGAPDGAHANGPTPVPGKVSGALSFDGVDDRVVVPHYPAADVGTGDFTIDAWIRVPATLAGGVHTMVDKRTLASSQYTGYSFYLYRNSSGAMHLGVQLADGGYANYTSPVLPIVGGQWHFAAVRVSRNATSHFVLDGTSYPFTPGHPGSLANPAPVSIGGSAIAAAYLGEIDELEFFGRALGLDELDSIRLADSEGKCKEACFLPPQLAFCFNQATVTATAWVCNATQSPQSYTAWFQGLATGPGCTIPGPTNFTPGSPINVGVVLPGQCKSFTVTIARPVGMTAVNLAGCYQMMVESTSGETFSCHGAVRDRRDLCSVAIGWDMTATTLRPHRPARLGPVRVTNTTTAPIALSYRFVAMNDDMLVDDTVLSLDGQAPGVQPTGNTTLPPGGYVDLNVSAEFVVADGLGTYIVQLEADTDGDGVPDFLGGRVLTQDLAGSLPTYTGVAAPTTAGTPVLSTSGPALIGSTFSVIADGLVPNGFAFLSLSTSLATPPFPLSLIGGQPTSMLYLDPASLLTFAVAVDGTGRATVPLSVPNNSALAGAVLHWQVFDFDPALPYALPLGNSNAMSVTIE